jgi:hypothetical protein
LLASETGKSVYSGFKWFVLIVVGFYFTGKLTDAVAARLTDGKSKEDS